MELAKLVVKLLADTKDFRGNMDGALAKVRGFASNAGGQIASFGKQVLKWGALAGASVALAAGGFAAHTIRMAGDAEEMMSKLQATFGDSSAAMIGDLDAFAAASNRSSFELRTQATDLGAVLKALGFTEGAAASLAAQTTKLAVDLGSFNNLPSADVAQRITRAYTGEFESLKALGIVINQAKLEQELLNMGVTDGVQAATDIQKAMAVNNLIMGQTADAQGDAVKTAGSFTNQLVGLKSGLHDTFVEIGLKLLPVVTPLIAKFGELADAHLPKLVSFVEKLSPAFGEVAEVITGLLSGGVEDPIGNLANMVFFLADAFGVGQEQAREIFNQVLELREPFERVKETLGGFIQDTVIPFVQEHGPAIKGAFLGIAAVLAGAAIVGIVASIGAAIAAVGPVVLGLMAAAALLGAAWAENWGGIQDKAQGAVDFIKGLIDFFRPALEGDWRKFGENLRGIWDDAWSRIREGLRNAIQRIRETNWGEVGRNILRGIASGITNSLGIIRDAAWRAANAALETAKGFLGIHSESRVFHEQVGMEIGAGTGTGIEQSMQQVMANLGNAFGQLAPAAVSAATPGGGEAAGGPAVVIHKLEINDPITGERLLDMIGAALSGRSQ